MGIDSSLVDLTTNGLRQTNEFLGRNKPVGNRILYLDPDTFSLSAGLDFLVSR